MLFLHMKVPVFVVIMISCSNALDFKQKEVKKWKKLHLPAAVSGAW